MNCTVSIVVTESSKACSLHLIELVFRFVLCHFKCVAIDETTTKERGRVHASIACNIYQQYWMSKTIL